jgi:hypothetical protein
MAIFLDYGGKARRANWREKGATMAGDVGERAPDFTLPSAHDGEISLSQYRGKKHVILSIHVLDFTGG